MTAPMAVKHGAVILLVLVLVVSANGRPNARPQRQVLMEERATLLAFKRGLIVPTSALADWNESNDDVCGFTGVSCDWRRRHVIGLSLKSMNISGTIRPVVGNLSHLRSLDMSNNSLTGLIPGELSNLRRLAVLTLAQNQLQGGIPESLAALSMVYHIDLNQNNLSGPIPASLFVNCTHLGVVDFGANDLSGEIPADIGDVINITGMNLSSNFLNGTIPESICRLPRLEWLCLSHNFLTGSIPPCIGNATKLGLLDLSGNKLSGAIPPVVGNLSQLIYLDLKKNTLHSSIPESLAALQLLRFFDLNQNNLSGPIPASLFLNCTQLEIVDFSVNNLSGEIPQDASANLTGQLTFLNLYSNQLIRRIPRWLANCTLLCNLDVEDNLLADELPTEIIRDKQHLLYLHLSNNRFWSHDGNTNLEPFFASVRNCSMIKEIEAGAVGIGGRLPSDLGSMLPPNISHLKLELNAIEGPIPADIGDVINITLMNLSYNLLNGTIPESICLLPRLQQLDLSDNFLTGAIPPCIGNATMLGELDLSRNALSGGIPSSIGNLGQLSIVFLRRNRLSGEIPASLVGRLRLDLSDNGLTGQIPEGTLGKIYLNLSHNQLGGGLPTGLCNMQQVQEIDLSRNKLTGAITPQLGDCIELTLLDLSHNSLDGKLPPSLGGLRYLWSLDVSYNNLSGEIPLNLSTCNNLTHLDLSYNDFSGDVPTTGALAKFTAQSYIGNEHLCGRLVDRECPRPSTSSWQSRKFLVIICVCAAVLAFVLTILCAVSIRKFREQLAVMRKDMFRSRRRSSGGSSPVMKYKYPRITYRELVEATEEFNQDRLVGTGSYGRVYRGALHDGTMVAVKVLQLQSRNSTKSFNRECQVLKRIRHRNLMRIITACSLPDFKALVLPFMTNGSLERCLYGGGPPAELNLVQRVNICSDIAEGMAYLHHHSPVKVIHCDLKPSNVLINDDMTALVSDFGISRLVMSVGGTAANTADVGASTANMLCGSIGYIPPEYGYGSNPTTKGDVYSFGVLVLEVVTKKKPTDDMFEGGLSLHKWVKSHYHGRADTVVDPALAGMVRDQTPEIRRMWDVAISELLELGILCTQESASMRPTMMDAADDLDRLKRYLGGDTTATFASSLGFSSTTIEDD